MSAYTNHVSPRVQMLHYLYYSAKGAVRFTDILVLAGPPEGSGGKSSHLSVVSASVACFSSTVRGPVCLTSARLQTMLKPRSGIMSSQQQRLPLRHTRSNFIISKLSRKEAHFPIGCCCLKELNMERSGGVHLAGWRGV